MARKIKPKFYANRKEGRLEEVRYAHEKLELRLESGLLSLMKGQRPRKLTLNGNPDREYAKPTTILYSYDTRGILITTSRFEGQELKFGYGNIEIQAYPSSAGKGFLTNLEKLMRRLEFKRG
ncbi:MAG: hypothetical protein WCK90_05255 [archaeon]